MWGLTGGIGSGKSTVSAMFIALGAIVIDADRITHELQVPGQPVFDAMVERFGSGIVAADGSLDRPAVAEIVFADPAVLAELNAIVHPAVGAERARQLSEPGDDDIVVLDVPLLVENGRDDLAGIIVVDVDPEIAVRRLVQHRGWPRPTCGPAWPTNRAARTAWPGPRSSSTTTATSPRCEPRSTGPGPSSLPAIRTQISLAPRSGRPWALVGVVEPDTYVGLEPSGAADRLRPRRCIERDPRQLGR